MGPIFISRNPLKVVGGPALGFYFKRSNLLNLVHIKLVHIKKRSLCYKYQLQSAEKYPRSWTFFGIFGYIKKSYQEEKLRKIQNHAYFVPILSCQKNRAFGSVFATWLRVLDEIRTYFKENPDADF
jgi:hypothetical protein